MNKNILIIAISIKLLTLGFSATAQLSRTNQANNITTNVYQNSTHAITGSVLQGVMLNQNNSYVNLISDTNLLDVRKFSPYTIYTPGMGCFYKDTLFMDSITQHGAWNRNNWVKVYTNSINTKPDTALVVTGGLTKTKSGTVNTISGAALIPFSDTNSLIATYKYVATHSTNWSLTGNSGTTPGTDFVGTNDGNSLQFKVDGQQAGFIQFNGTGNFFGSTFLGYGAGNNLGGGNNDNTAIGSGALNGWGGGTGNNVAIGNEAEDLTTSGTQNVAIGVATLKTNYTGSNNTAVGYESFDDNNYLSNSNYNTGIGTYTGDNIRTGSYNMFAGYEAGVSEIYGSGNTFIGNEAGAYSNSDYNVAIGDSALLTNTTGSKNTGLGYFANVASNNLTNATVIGYNATVDSSNSIIFGNSSVIRTGFNGALEPYYSSAYQHGTVGQILTSQGADAAPQWTTTTNYLNDTAGGAGNLGYPSTQLLTTISGVKVGGQYYPSTLSMGNTSNSTQIISAGNNSILFNQGGTNAGDINNNGYFVGLGYGTSNAASNHSTALGAVAGYNGMSNYVTAVGSYCFSSDAGLYSTGVGAYAGDNSLGIGDCFFGYLANGGNATKAGSDISAFGDSAALYNIGSFNSYFGDKSGTTNTTGTYNTSIGFQANVASNNLTNATAIGANSTVDSSNSIIFGNSSVIRTGFHGALEPYYSSAYQHGTAGQVLTSQGTDAAPQWATTTNYLNDTAGGSGTTPQLATQQAIRKDTLNTNNFLVGNAYMKSYVATHSSGGSGISISDTAGGSGNLGYPSTQVLTSISGIKVGGQNIPSSALILGNTGTGGFADFEILARNTPWLYFSNDANSILLGSSTNVSSYGVTIGVNACTDGVGQFSTVVGGVAGYFGVGSYTTILGYRAGINGLSGTGSDNTLIGSYAYTYNASISNCSAIGYDAEALYSNTIMLGNSNVTEIQVGSGTSGNYALSVQVSTATTGTVTATSAQVLELDGAATALTIILPSSPIGGQTFEITTNQSSITLSYTGSELSLPTLIGAVAPIKMYYSSNNNEWMNQ